MKVGIFVFKQMIGNNIEKNNKTRKTEEETRG
jgi:hypothetical protein